MLVFLQAAPTITFESPGITVKALVKEMAKQSGRNLEAGVELSSDRLIVRFHDATLEDAMKMLSKVEAGKWTSSKGWTYFRQDADEVERRELASKAKLVDGWTGLIDHATGQMGPSQYDLQWAGSFAERFRNLVQQRNVGHVDDFLRLEAAKYALPARRAMVRLLEQIGPEKLAATPNGVVEYATSANSLQIRLDSAATDVLNQWKSEEAIWAQVSSGKFVGKAETRGAKPTDLSQASGMILMLSTHAHRAGGVATLTAYDRAGTVLKSEVVALSLGSVKDLDDEATQEKEDAAHPRWVDIPSLTYRLYKARDERLRPEEVKDWWNHDPAFKRAILNPDEVDYSAEILGRQSLAMAEDRGENLIIPEIATLARFFPKTAFKDGKMNANVLRSALQRNEPEKNGANWFVIPRSSAEEEFLAGQGSVDSKELGDFVRQADSTSSIALDPYAELLKNNDGSIGAGNDFNLIQKVIEAVEPDLPGLGWFANSPIETAFYGTLGESFRYQARTIHGLDIAGLSLENWRPLLKDPLMLEGLKFANQAEDKATIYTDPFVFFDSVNAKKGTLQILDGEGDAVLVNRDGRDQYFRPSEWQSQQNAKSKELSNDKYFRQALRKWVKIVIDFNGKASLNFELDCDTPLGDSVPTYETLPQAFKDRMTSSARTSD